jgi:glutathione synthase/RimK-type ligase-like ATP-grasp enzyme
MSLPISESALRPLITQIIIVERVQGIVAAQPGRLILTPSDYIAGRYAQSDTLDKRVRTINLCHGYGYLSTGYYCSLLADARGQRCTPAVTDVIHAQWKRLHSPRFVELTTLLNHPDARQAIGHADHLDVWFGRAETSALDLFTRKAFDLFRLPAMRIGFTQTPAGPVVSSVRVMALPEIAAMNAQDAFNVALDEFSGSAWSENARAKPERYWLAILHDPDAQDAPSNAEALEKFIRVGHEKGVYVELITRANADSLLEFDALFIRETTAVNNHTYRLAEKAEREGLIVIDDPTSIRRCCNKVYLHEAFLAHDIPTPASEFLYKRERHLPHPGPGNFPLVLKVPDGSFSRGVFKVNSESQFIDRCAEMFKTTEIILMQAFMPSDYDWRIVLLGGEPLLACRYHMARGHWQILNHAAAAADSTGDDGSFGSVDCVPLSDVPPLILETAKRAAALIGDGLYGVDLKEVDGKPFVIEVNDNPNLDAGYEDLLMGDALYAAIIDYFKVRIDAE